MIKVSRLHFVEGGRGEVGGERSSILNSIINIIELYTNTSEYTYNAVKTKSSQFPPTISSRLLPSLPGESGREGGGR